LSGLFLNIDTTVHCYDSEFIFIMFQFGNFIGDLNCKLSSWSKTNSLNSSASKKSVSS
jgi:hypothetical protein